MNSKYYLLLEINKNASQDEIKKAYYKKAHKLHPDKNKNIDTTEEFQKLNKAYEALSDFRVNEEIEKVSHESGYYQDLGNGFIIKSYDNREVDIENYKINLEDLSCNCSDWKNNRKQYNRNDIRRLCKHIIASFSILEINPKYQFDYEDYSVKDMQLPDNLKIFKDKIIACRDNREGIDLYWFNELIVLNSYIIYVSKHKKGLHVFSKKYHKLMYVRLDSNRTNIDIESVSYISHISYYGDYRNNLAIIHKNKLSKLFFTDELKKFFNNKYSECTDFLALFDMDKYNNDNDEEQLKINKAWRDGYLLTNQFEYSLPFFINSLSDNEKFKRNIELMNIKKKTNVYLLYQQYKRYLELQDETLSKYSTTQKLLKLNKSNIDTRKFNIALKEMGFITKKKYVNRNNWIIKGDGLEFGINYINSSSLIHIKVPDWYKISYFDYETLSLQYEYRYGLLKMTDILWKKSKFNDLLEIIKNYLLMPKIDKKIKLKKNIKKRTTKLKIVNPEREEWLKNINCPYCNGKNIHKKDKRQRKEYKVQRYMCMDCKKIFQQII